jgi:hypothetical protein
LESRWRPVFDLGRWRLISADLGSAGASRSRLISAGLSRSAGRSRLRSRLISVAISADLGRPLPRVAAASTSPSTSSALESPQLTPPRFVLSRPRRPSCWLTSSAPSARATPTQWSPLSTRCASPPWAGHAPLWVGHAPVWAGHAPLWAGHAPLWVGHGGTTRRRLVVHVGLAWTLSSVTPPI